MSKMTVDHPSTAQLSQFLSDEASQEQSERITRHVDECETCQNVLDNLSNGSNQLLRRLSELKSWLDAKSGRRTVSNKRHGNRDSNAGAIHFERGEDERFSIRDPIAAGGMGVVYRGYDFELQREVAIKVIAPATNDLDQLVAEERFQREAVISGQLQHPGVVPIHKLGQLKNGRMFIAMKLVNGRTLAQLLDRKTRSPAFVSRLLDIFGQVCQTVAYAHSRSIIHRDLKPQNIMVGSFGETQVMDWGLAKQLSDTETDETQENKIDFPADVESISSETLKGVVLGTPAYMAPEQRLGRSVDHRTDVFSLGGILCEILTGTAPFADSAEISKVESEINKELNEARARLKATASDPELTQLAMDCLEFVPAKRPIDASVLSLRLNDYFYRRDEILLQSQLERARSQTKLMAERKRRKQVMLMGTIVATFFLCTTVASIFYWSEKNARLNYRHRIELTKSKELLARNDAIKQALQQAQTHYRQALGAHPDHQGSIWAKALMQVRKAEGLVDDSIGKDLLQEFKQLKRDVEKQSETAELARQQRIKDGAFCDVVAVSILDSFFQNRGMWFGPEPDFLKRLEDAFGDYEIETFDDVEPLVQKIHESRISAELLQGLQHWQSQFFWLKRDREKTKPIRTWFCEVLDAADPNVYRTRLRQMLLQRDVPALVAEMQNPQALESLSAVQLIIDGTRRCKYEDLPKLLANGYWKKRYEFLSAAFLQYPGEFSVNYFLATHCLGDGTPRRELDLKKAAEHLLICNALEPQCPGVLARLMDVYTRLKDSDNANIYGNQLTQLNPKMAEAHYIVALYSSILKNHELAVSSAQRAIELDSQFISPYTLLCQIFLKREEFERAKYYGDAVVKVRPDHKSAQYWSQEVARQTKLAKNKPASNDAPADGEAKPLIRR